MTDILPATQALLAQMPSMPKTARALAMVKDGEVLGIAGFYPEGTRLWMFATFTDRARDEKRAIVRGWRQLRAMVQRRGLPVHAVCDKTVEASERFLVHLGFSKVTPDVYEWRG